MTKLNETKVEDISLMYKYFKRINQQYRGKLFNNLMNSLAKVFKLSASTIRPVVEGAFEGLKSKRNLEKYFFLFYFIFIYIFHYIIHIFNTSFILTLQDIQIQDKTLTTQLL